MISDIAHFDGSRTCSNQNLCIKCKTRRWMLLSPHESLLLLHSHSKSYMANSSEATGVGMRKITSFSGLCAPSPPSAVSCWYRNTWQVKHIGIFVIVFLELTSCCWGSWEPGSSRTNNGGILPPLPPFQIQAAGLQAVSRERDGNYRILT